MSARATGTFVWADYAPADQEQALRFYHEFAGWTGEALGPEFGGYAPQYLGDSGDDADRTAGVNPAMGPDQPPVWTPYFATSDAEATIARAVEAGATVPVGPMGIPGTGTMAVLTDPTGGSTALWQAEGMDGFGRFGEPGAFCWTELHSTDARAAVAFYETIFGVTATTLSETDDFTYFQMFVPGQEEAAFGIMQLGKRFPAGTKTFWQLYLAVASADEAVAKASELGSTIIHPGHDTAFGRLAVIQDPQGALLALIEQNDAVN